MKNIAKTGEILNHLNQSIVDKTPFSLIRFGDGGLKMMISVQNNVKKNINIISDKEGIPNDKMSDILKLWAKYANLADYIDNPDIYDTEEFWGRYKNNRVPINTGTKKLLQDWENVYNGCGISTKDRNFCNPEFNWLSILRRSDDKFNLIDLMKDKKICFISIYKNIPRLNKFDIDYVRIVPHYKNQFKNSFTQVIKYINTNANKYDLWLNSSGELGRVYSGVIKENGGRVLDMGFVAQYWFNFQRPDRFNRYIQPDISNSLQVNFTKFGEQYKDYI